MGRIRTIKPEFPQSQSMGKVSRDARLLFVLLWTIADDEGRTRAASRMLASLLYPYDDDAPKLIGKWLGELERVGSIRRYEVDGDDYLEVCKWSCHQKIDRPSKSKFPAPSSPREPSTNDRESSTLDQGSGIKDQGGSAGASRGALDETFSKKHPLQPDDVPQQTWDDWVSHRSKKRATVSQTVMDELRKQAKAAGVTVADAMAICVANGWQGFRADWMGKAGKPAPGSNLGKPTVEHPRGMPIPFDSPLSPCLCAMCEKARKKGA